jgi:hypothetical protein
MSEPEGYNDDCENHNTTVANTEENSNDENDVDDETMSGKQMSAHIRYACVYKLQINIYLPLLNNGEGKYYRDWHSMIEC